MISELWSLQVNKPEWLTAPTSEEVKASADFGQGLDTERELELDEAPILQTQTQVVPRLFSAVRRFPLTFSLIVMTALLFPVGMGLGQGAIDGLFERLMFLALEEVNGQQYFTTMSYTVEQGQWWSILRIQRRHIAQ